MHHRSPLTTLTFYDKRKREEHLANLRIPKRWKQHNDAARNDTDAESDTFTVGDDDCGDGGGGDESSLGITTLGAAQALDIWQ